MELRSDLICDIGVNNGDDTAYYLFKGFRVVGIEADPTLIVELQQRFATEIAGGRLTLVNIALAPTRTVAPFWICEGNKLWNSFDREVASRMGHKARAVDVDCWPLHDIFAEYGVPHYLKMSLHGHEHFCLTDIQPDAAPTYLSLELPRDRAIGDEIFSRLATLRYDGCKIIDQRTQRQMVASPPTVKGRLRRALKRYPPLYAMTETVVGAGKSMLGASGEPPASHDHSVGGWRFPEGSSGPFGEETDGPWRQTSEAWGEWKAFLAGETDLDSTDLSIWHDLHAVRRQVS